MLAIHDHAKGKPYRALILCPDHLISVWEKELTETIPDVIVHRFDKWKDFIAFLDKGHAVLKEIPGDKASRSTDKPGARASSGNASQDLVQAQGRRVVPSSAGTRPSGIPTGSGLSGDYRGINGKLDGPTSRKYMVVDHEPKVDEQGRPMHRPALAAS